MQTRVADSRDIQKRFLGSASNETHIALRSRGDATQALTILDRLPTPTDVWLHPGRRWLAVTFERHPMTRRVLFSPVRDARFAGNAISRLPVYGAYEEVIDV